MSGTARNARSTPERIAVVGGGFSGALSAVNIARFSEDPVHVIVIDRQRPIGRGVAYALRRPEFLLNVAAANMSAFPDQPDHFLRWLNTRPEYESTPESDLRTRFVPRQTYGDYLSAIVSHYLRGPAVITPVSTQFIAGEVVDLIPAGDGCDIRLADGTAVSADRVVIATGNETPAGLPGADGVAGHPAWVGNPWEAWEHRIPAHGGSVVILGTGLTAVDVILTLRANGWMGEIHAVSRHGWFPRSHFRVDDDVEFPPPGVDVTALDLDSLVALVEEHCRALSARGLDPAIVVDKLRSHTQPIWAGLTDRERTEFAREHAARWNVHRHRIAPEIHAQLSDSQSNGQLHTHAGSIAGLEPSRNRLLVHLDDAPEPLAGDLVICATGPATKLTATRSTLLQNLIHRGLIAPDAMNMGIRVADDHTVLTADGSRSPWLLTLGPLLKGTYWETIAVPELRVQARRIAETILDRARADDELPPMLEYML